MSLTIAAVLFAVMILPGVAALAAFYKGINTPEVRLTPPPMGTVSSIVAVGVSAVLAHLLLAALLTLNAWLPTLTEFPPANPYQLMFAPATAQPAPVDLFASFLGLGLSILIGVGIGFAGAAGNWELRNRMVFGWLYPILQKARPEENYINAYVLSTITNGADTLGYEGTVEHLALSEQRAITAVTLVNVSTFYLRMRPGGVERVPANSRLQHLALREGDYRNIALVVIRDPSAA